MGQPAESHVSASHDEFIVVWKPTGGSEPSQYPQEEKATAIPSVAASERGTAQTGQVQACRRCLVGVVGRCSSRLQTTRGVRNYQPSRRLLEQAAIEGESPVGKR